jgi:hypothetical protein
MRTSPAFCFCLRGRRQLLIGFLYKQPKRFYVVIGLNALLVVRQKMLLIFTILFQLQIGSNADALLNACQLWNKTDFLSDFAKYHGQDSVIIHEQSRNSYKKLAKSQELRFVYKSHF